MSAATFELGTPEAEQLGITTPLQLLGRLNMVLSGGAELGEPRYSRHRVQNNEHVTRWSLSSTEDEQGRARAVCIVVTEYSVVQELTTRDRITGQGSRVTIWETDPERDNKWCKKDTVTIPARELPRITDHVKAHIKVGAERFLGRDY